MKIWPLLLCCVAAFLSGCMRKEFTIVKSAVDAHGVVCYQHQYHQGISCVQVAQPVARTGSPTLESEAAAMLTRSGSTEKQTAK